MDPRDKALIADPTIAEVFDEFLAGERERLSDRTFRRYEDIIDLLTACLDGYACNYLPKEEGKLFDRLFDAEGEDHREFSEVFGPEHILIVFDEFLGYFMPRKVMAGKDLQRAAGTVTKKLAKWLAGKGYVEADDAVSAAARGAEAVRDLPDAQDLIDLLEEHSEGDQGDGEAEEGHFTFTRVEGKKVWVEDLAGRECGPIRLPIPVAACCTIGWTFSGMIGRRGKSWYLAEIWNVYP